jgi:hypothetical protein
VSNIGVNNFERPEAVFAECGRVTRPGGCLALTTNPAGHLQELSTCARPPSPSWASASACPSSTGIAHRLTADRIETLLREAGLASVRRRADPFTLSYVDGTAFFTTS